MLEKLRYCFFLLGFATLATHELDAVTQQEWRLLYVLRGLSPEMGELVFVALHVPLFATLLWLMFHKNEVVREFSRNALGVFLIIHVILHENLKFHPQYTFFSWLSQSLIYGGGLLGFAYLRLSIVSKRRTA